MTMTNIIVFQYWKGVSWIFHSNQQHSFQLLRIHRSSLKFFIAINRSELTLFMRLQEDGGGKDPFTYTGTGFTKQS